MWCLITLLAAAGLAPAAVNNLTVANVRTTYGVLGPPRRDTKFLPGDDFALSFDIQGAKANAAGKVLYSVGMEVRDHQGKVQYRQLPMDQEVDAPPAGKSLPACAHVQIGLDQEPGELTVKVSVTDRVARVSSEITQTCEILPRAFGLVRVTTTSDPDGKLPVPLFRQGQTGWINFAAVGFGQAKSTGQPRVGVTMRVLDQAGRSVLAKPSVGEISKDAPPNARHLLMQFALEINRTGKFTVELTATDHVTGQSVNVTFPLTVAK